MIHSEAIIEDGAILADNVRIGPWSYVGSGVEIDSGTRVESHVVLRGPTKIGRNNHIYQFSSIGEDTPDLKYQGESTSLVVGDNNVIRENVTIHRGTIQGLAETRIGNNNLIMAYVHVGHDSLIGDHTILVNNVALAGHVYVGDWAILSGYTLVHQFCMIGAHAFTGMGTSVGKDIPAYMTASGAPAKIKTVNSEGLRRRGFSAETISQFRRAYKIIYRQGLTIDAATKRLEEMLHQTPELDLLIKSLRSSERGIVR